MHDEFIILADDHPIFRDGMFALVRELLPHSRIASVDTFASAIEVARAGPSPPSMFIVDLFFGGESIASNLGKLREEFLFSSIVVVSMASDKASIDAVMNAGANGFVNKAASPNEIRDLLKAVRNGDVVVNMPFPARTMEAPTISPSPSPNLSQRQIDVLHLIADGRTNKEIAILLGISPFTVRIHVSAIFRTLGTTTRAGAVARGIALGLVPTSQTSTE
ncbi:response regulator transcription factor [Rhizobium oryziradicis]|uniref:DNA-binding response regulator n=1 Tax=Rhizobium oryziradicis TaxID=1867956 RepID=A0A1Q8ZMT0_9HYPH|nr:response regulator transcription factor [Rhizobium oryziradicis]OLP43066.1 hypothetical protein BJF95_19180 [Rhizobium oryziradicis]